jgi:hypothetical protein
MTTLRWLRVPGDTLFAIGAMVIIAFIAGVGRRVGAPAASDAPSRSLAERDLDPSRVIGEETVALHSK